jgi:hypothetical protein
VFPVRYDLYVLYRRNSVFKGLIEAGVGVSRVVILNYVSWALCKLVLRQLLRYSVTETGNTWSRADREGKTSRARVRTCFMALSRFVYESQHFVCHKHCDNCRHL